MSEISFDFGKMLNNLIGAAVRQPLPTTSTTSIPKFFTTPSSAPTTTTSDFGDMLMNDLASSARQMFIHQNANGTTSFRNPLTSAFTSMIGSNEKGDVCFEPKLCGMKNMGKAMEDMSAVSHRVLGLLNTVEYCLIAVTIVFCLCLLSTSIAVGYYFARRAKVGGNLNYNKDTRYTDQASWLNSTIRVPSTYPDINHLK